MIEMDDTALIAAARAGDEQAFRALHEEHAAYVRAIGRSILHTSDLEDMCQDTFLLAFTRLESFEGNSQFRTWLTRIAINQCLLLLRRGKQRTHSEDYTLHLEPERLGDQLPERCVFVSHDRQLENVGPRLDLQRLLRRLHPSQRRVMEMAYLEDVPDLAIAESLGITVPAVKCTLHRAKRRLRNL